MRALSGKKEPHSTADALIWHADVRRMLLTQKAIAEGGRAMIYAAAQTADLLFNAVLENDPATREQYDHRLGFYTPILKGFLTEMGLEAANLGMQVFGGHGYIHEHGMEQIARDARIATLYEGTTGIQALDLLGRKVLGSGGKLLQGFTAMIDAFCAAHDGAEYAEFVKPLRAHSQEWLGLSMKLGEAAMANADNAGAAAVDYLMYSGYVTLAYFWARMAVLAKQKIAAAPGEVSFYEAKVMTARFYFERLLPRTESLKITMLAGADNLMRMPEALFQL